MGNLIVIIGWITAGVGGSCLAVAIAGFTGWLASIAWVAFSESFRSICKAESLIHEYRKNREEFMALKAAKDGADNG